MLGKTESRRRGWQRMTWLNAITNSIDKFEKAPGDGEGQGSLTCCSSWGWKESNMTERQHNNSMCLSPSWRIASRFHTICHLNWSFSCTFHHSVRPVASDCELCNSIVRFHAIPLCIIGGSLSSNRCYARSHLGASHTSMDSGAADWDGKRNTNLLSKYMSILFMINCYLFKFGRCPV